MKRFNADRKVLKFLQGITFLIFCFVLCITAIVLSYVPIIMWTICSLCFVAITFLYLPLYWKRAYVTAQKDKITVFSGNISTKETVVFINAVEYTTTRKFLYISILHLTTFGGDVMIPFLRAKDAYKIIEFISENRKPKSEDNS